MSERDIFNGLLIGWFILAAVVFILLFFIAAPYGRHLRRGWGYTLGNKLGWVLMEAPAPIIMAVCFLIGSNYSVTTILFLVMWEAHYLHRAFVYPFSLRGRERHMPLAVVLLGFVFNIMNGYLNGRYIFNFSGGYKAEWLYDPRFIIGVILFAAGYVINRQADQVLKNLRQPRESGYKVASLGFYRWVSCPNYFGEITIWLGWALATWSPAGLAFAVWTIANLVPRARAHHKWYREYFVDYPAARKALLPGIW